MTHSKRRPAKTTAQFPLENSLSNTSDASNTTPAAPENLEANALNAGTGARSKGGLLKVLGMWFGIAAAVGNTIAAGIVRSPGDIAQWLPNIYLFFGAWIAGGLYALVGASSMAELGAYYEEIRPRLFACEEAKKALRLTFHPPVPDGNRALKLGLPPVSALAFSTLPRWARRMYGWPSGPLSDMAATAGLRATRLAFNQQRLFLGAMRAIHRAESAGETARREHRTS